MRKMDSLPILMTETSVNEPSKELSRGLQRGYKFVLNCLQRVLCLNSLR